MWAQEVAALCLQAQQQTGTGMSWVQGKDPPSQLGTRGEAKQSAFLGAVGHLGIYDFSFINISGI